MRSMVAAVLASVAMTGTAASPAPPLPEIRDHFLQEGMPSFGQRNSEFVGGGRTFCAPTAASNALMWLADRGYPGLKPAAADNASAQKEMIKQLASLMGTYREGTSLDCFTCGVNTYVRNAGYRPKSWTVSGNGARSRNLVPPDVGLVRSLGSGNTVLWLGLGWYAKDESGRSYLREYGHWVTLVGYGRNREGQVDPATFVLADPEAPSGYRYVTLQALGDGRISNGRTRADVRGYYSLTELDSVAVRRPDEYCVLESIQALTLE